MNDFALFFLEGLRHITDLNGYDHILFITALCLPYVAKDWKKIGWLVTAFTIGHSVTLALSTYNKIIIGSKWVEWLIPVTIMLAAIQNVVVKKREDYNWPGYIMALLFGLIHGMGFSNYLRSMMGKEESILTPLLAFNIGLEAGQILIVLLVMLVGFIFAGLLKVPRREWILFVSGGIFAAALQMVLERSAAL